MRISILKSLQQSFLRALLAPANEANAVATDAAKAASGAGAANLAFSADQFVHPQKDKPLSAVSLAIGTPVMKPNRRSIAMSCLVIAALSGPSLAMASGFSQMPEVRQAHSTHKACVARLKASKAEHRKRVKPRAFKADGGFQEVFLEDRSGGVKITDRKTARYEARLWYHNGRLLEDGLQYEVSHSWEMTNLECQDKVLITKNANGFTLSTFEPVRPKKP